MERQAKYPFVMAQRHDGNISHVMIEKDWEIEAGLMCRA